MRGGQVGGVRDHLVRLRQAPAAARMPHVHVAVGKGLIDLRGDVFRHKVLKINLVWLWVPASCARAVKTVVSGVPITQNGSNCRAAVLVLQGREGLLTLSGTQDSVADSDGLAVVKVLLGPFAEARIAVVLGLRHDEVLERLGLEQLKSRSISPCLLKMETDYIRKLMSFDRHLHDLSLADKSSRSVAKTLEGLSARPCH